MHDVKQCYVLDQNMQGFLYVNKGLFTFIPGYPYLTTHTHNAKPNSKQWFTIEETLC
jgi:hypothetical protein